MVSSVLPDFNVPYVRPLSQLHSAVLSIEHIRVLYLPVASLAACAGGGGGRRGGGPWASKEGAPKR